MNDKSEAFKKIKIQMNKNNKKVLSEEKMTEIVQGIIDANIPKIDNTIIESEMPEQIMGISVDWNKLNTQSVDKQSVDKQSVDKQSVDKQSVDKQSVDKQSVDKQSVDKQVKSSNKKSKKKK